MAKTCKKLKERLPRNKYHDIDRARLAYAKQRKHTKAATNKLRRRLLGLLSKQIGQWNRICKIHTVDIALTAEQSKRLGALKEVFRQQNALAQKKEVKHRIVSIDRPYIRPIVRGKENKRVAALQGLQPAGRRDRAGDPTEAIHLQDTGVRAGALGSGPTHERQRRGARHPHGREDRRV